MKTEDFERLKAVCEKEGFQIEIFGIHNEILKITPKDIWDGVEFCRNKYTGICSPISQINTLKYDNGMYVFREHNEPITQDYYESYLKKEAKDRFWEIKEGDRFKGNGLLGMIQAYYTKEWDYDKKEDLLTYFGRVLYQQGRWAERMKERVEVEYGYYSLPFHEKYILAVHFAIDNPNRMDEKAGQFLAKQLEAYLNGEIE